MDRSRFASAFRVCIKEAAGTSGWYYKDKLSIHISEVVAPFLNLKVCGSFTVTIACC